MAYEEVTSPILTDATGQDIVDKLDEIAQNLQPPTNIEASDVSYDNTQSGMTATDVQEAVDELKSNLTYKTDHVTGQTEFIVPSTATEVIVVCYVDSSTACGVFHLPNPRTLPIDLRPVTGYNIVANSAGGYIYINVNHTTGGIQLLNFIIGGQEKRANATLYFYYR